MMTFVWLGMLGLSIFCTAITGRFGVLTPAAMQGAQAGLTLCLSLGGAMCLFSGLGRLMECAGISRALGKLLRPIFRRLFPETSRDSVALGYLSANVSANLLGLGNAATPMGILAVKRMQALRPSPQASDEMCLFVVINTASIQILPSTVAAVRASLGAASAFDILPAVWLSSICSVSVGILSAKLLRKCYA